MKYNNILKHFGWVCLLSLTWVGCTDWDDHYDEEGKQIAADNTLWEEIVARPELSDFKECLERYGYKEKLNGTQMYTVFAPVGKMDTINLTDTKIQTEVIENHIARFAHSANSATNDKSVVMLNTKAINFTQVGDSVYMFGDKKLTGEYNIRAKNGVLHVIEGQQPFAHNIWEYLTTDTRFDNVRNYLYSFNDTILDENKSIKGEINANGQQEYLDSVIYIYNELFYAIGKLNDEDSTYTMILPTNEAWDEAYGRIQEYYIYSEREAKYDSLQKRATGLAVVRDLVFSHTMQGSVEDSLVSTTGGVFENPFEYILADYTDSTQCSNGEVFVVNELKHKPWDSWHEEITVEVEKTNALNVDTVLEKNAIIYRRDLSNADSLYTKVSGGSFLEVVDRNTKSHPSLTFNVWNTLKGKYDLKIVFLPQKMATSRVKTLLPNLFKVEYSCLKQKRVSNADDWMTKKARIGGNSKTFKNDPLKIDTVFIGTIDTQCCSYGTETPDLQITVESYWSRNNTNKKKYSTTMLIDCIILEPSKE